MRRTFIPLIGALIILTGCSGVIAWIGLLQSGSGDSGDSSAILAGDAERGADLFRTGINGVPPCSDCHRAGMALGGIALGPNLSGIEDRAGRRIEGLSAEAYIAQSILEPSAYVVRGFRSSMYDSYGDHYDEQDIADLTAYLLSL